MPQEPLNLSKKLNDILKQSGMKGTIIMVYKDPVDGDDTDLRYSFAQNLMNDRQALAYMCEAIGALLHTATPGLVVNSDSEDA